MRFTQSVIVVSAIILGCHQPPWVLASGVKPCPQPSAHFASETRPEYTPVSAKFVNRVGVPVTFLWVNYDGEEMPGTQAYLNPGDTGGQETYSGHAWRIYTSDQEPKVLIKEFIIEVEDPSDTTTTVYITGCKGVQQAKPSEFPSEWQIENEPSPKDSDINTESLSQTCDTSLLSEWQEQGCHTVCLLDLTDEEKAIVGGSATVRLSVFQDDFKDTAATESFLLPSSIADVAAFTDFIEAKLGVTQSVRTSGVFSMKGQKLRTLDLILKEKTVMLFEGGQWVWPGIKIGHRYEFGHLTFDNKITVMETLSFQPKVFEIKEFLIQDENEHIIERARPKLSDAAVATKDSDVGKETSEWRISKYYFMPSEGDPKLQKIESRVETLTRIPIVNFEDPQVLRYDKKGFYSAHHDFFDPSAYVNNPHMSKMVSGGKNRLATVFFYLSNVTQGGETAFPRAGGLPQPYDYKDCSKGFSVKPLAGKVILFYSLLPNGRLDDYSLHGGCKVTEGEKWSVNFWLWNTPQSNRLARMVGENLDYLRDEL